MKPFQRPNLVTPYQMLTSLLIAAALCALSLQAQEAAVVSKFQEPAFVDIVGKEGTAAVGAELGSPIKVGDAITVATRGRVKLDIKDGSVLTIGQKSKLRIVSYEGHSRQVRVDLIYGTVRIEVAEQDASSRFEVRMPNAICHGLGGDLVIDASTPASVLVIGHAEVSTKDANAKMVQVKEGQFVKLEPAPSAPADITPEMMRKYESIRNKEAPSSGNEE